MSDSVQIFARFRPKNKAENEHTKKSKAAGVPQMSFWKSLNDTSITVSNPKDPPKKKKQQFTFDGVFLQGSTQEEVYQKVISIDDLFRGVNVAVMFYGQSGSGKTHSAMGDVDNPDQMGIMPRAVREIFDRIEYDEEVVTSVQTSYIEIYAENIRDLLTENNDRLKIREMKGKKGKTFTYIDGCTVEKVETYEDTMNVIREGNSSRCTGSTKLNSASSRSHSIFILNLTQNDIKRNVRRSSKLYIVDLAGSEKVKKTGASGDRLKEAKYINKSLSALRNVTSALTTGKDHVPYRDSKLTYLLRDTLGGNSRTSIVITCSPSKLHHDESWNTIQFGINAKKMQNTPVVNEVYSVETYKRLVAELKARITVLEEENRRMSGLLADNHVQNRRASLIEMGEEAEALANAIVDQKRPESPRKKPMDHPSMHPLERMKSMRSDVSLTEEDDAPNHGGVGDAGVWGIGRKDRKKSVLGDICENASDTPVLPSERLEEDPSHLALPPSVLTGEYRPGTPVSEQSEHSEMSEVDVEDSTDDDMDFVEEVGQDGASLLFSNDMIVFGSNECGKGAVVRMRSLA